MTSCDTEGMLQAPCMHSTEHASAMGATELALTPQDRVNCGNWHPEDDGDRDACSKHHVFGRRGRRLVESLARNCQKAHPAVLTSRWPRASHATLYCGGAAVRRRGTQQRRATNEPPWQHTSASCARARLAEIICFQDRTKTSAVVENANGME